MRLMMRQVAMGERIPTGYAIAWVHPHQHIAVVLPIGLAQIAAWLRFAWQAVVIFHAPDRLEQAYRRGVDDGLKIGVQRRQILDWDEAKARCCDELLAQLSNR